MSKFIFFFCALLFTGCATFEEQKKLDSFEYVTLKYEHAIRWGYYEAANDFRRVDESELQGPDYEMLKEIRVTYYEVLKSNPPQKNSLMAEQMVEIKYYHINRMIEKSLIDKQLWEYDREEEKWYLKSSLPDFK